ncbi:MAG: hypothetical protein IPL46_04535 [Saprospiraceae bacterium]|nr:hypothetical protein [Saprospiraceae bacterium]
MTAFYDALDNPTDEHWEPWKTDNESTIAQWESFFKKYDFAICPVTYGAAFKKCKLGQPISVDGNKVPYSAYLIPYSTVFAATGNPTVTIPVGLNKEGLPIGLQIVGPYYSEPELLHFTKLSSKLIAGFVIPDRVK